MIKLAFGKNTMQQWMDGLEGTLGAGRSKAIVSPSGTFMQIRKKVHFLKVLYLLKIIYIIDSLIIAFYCEVRKFL